MSPHYTRTASSGKTYVTKPGLTKLLVTTTVTSFKWAFIMAGFAYTLTLVGIGLTPYAWLLGGFIGGIIRPFLE